MRALVFVSTFVALATSAAAGPVNDREKRQSGTYDYIIIGGGTAGLVLADRLSEDPNVQVAIIEPGTSHQLTSPVLSTTPAGDVVFVGASPTDQNILIDWNFITTPQAGANGRSVSYTRGKCLGGSSARNFMIYQRGDTGSYQRWAEAVGDDSYTFDNLLPYFKKSVKFTPPNEALRADNATAEYNSAAFSPTGGPLEVSYGNYAGPFSSYMEAGMNAIGIPTVKDFNSGSLLGTQYCSSTIRAREQKRDSSETSFLHEASSRPNLKVFTPTRAHKIIFNENKQATGVDIGLGVVLTVKKEVILSAGAFQSPQLLMLSGIGPKETLDRYNIPVIADRPSVGQNMQDHVMFGITYRYNVETLTRLVNDLVYTAKKFAVDYTLFRRGVFTSPVADYIAWEKAPRDLITPVAAAVLDQYPASWPDIEYFSTPGLVGNFSNVLTSQPKDGYQYASILGALVAPISRGTVTIKSNSIFDLPIIDPNWLTDPTDVSVAIAAFKRMRAAFSTDAMRAGQADENEYAPGDQVQTDAQILDTIRNTLMTVWHASCTCKMGRTDDPMAVVDTRARVIGVKGLRVVDASSMALLPAGHPQSTIYALAEKIADDIKNGR